MLISNQTNLSAVLILRQMIHHKKLVSHTMVHEKLIQFYKGQPCMLHCCTCLINR